jgi:iduronate 2-sulfatase
MPYSGRLFMFLFFALAASITLSPPAISQQPKNVLLICIDDLRPELNCFGAEYIHSPNIDALAARGRKFTQHFVQAPTCGASRYALLTGRYGGRSNEAIFALAKEIAKGTDIPPSMPAWFRKHGYRTVSVGKVSHHPGGRGGPDWNDQQIIEIPGAWDRHLCPTGAWQHPRGFMHGLANGEIRDDVKSMDVFQSADGGDSIYPDGLTTDEGLRQLSELAADKDKPFFLAVGLLRPHLPFGAPAKYMAPYEDAKLPDIKHPNKPTGKTTWHSSGEFMKYNRWGRDPNKDAEFATEVRKHYAACVSYADAQVGRILAQLDASGTRENTLVVLWGDHGWHLGEHAIWGKHSLFEESLHSPLIFSAPGITNHGQATDGIVETIDIFPTLCQLAAIPKPDFTAGVSLVPQLRDAKAAGHAAISYAKSARTIRTATHRLIVHSDKHVELYDRILDAGETRNIAQQAPELVAELTKQLDSRYPE